MGVLAGGTRNATWAGVFSRAMARSLAVIWRSARGGVCDGHAQVGAAPGRRQIAKDHLGGGAGLDNRRRDGLGAGPIGSAMDMIAAPGPATARQ